MPDDDAPPAAAPPAEAAPEPVEDSSTAKPLSQGMFERKIGALLIRHASEEHSAETYVEAPEIVLPEYEQETGESKKVTKERMAKLATAGAQGFGTTAMGIGLRDLGYAIAKAGEDKEKNGGRINVKNIAKQAERIEARSKYTLADLQGKQIPGVDPHLKEEYLADDYFPQAFGCDREKFMSYPKWKKEQLKKKAQLF